MKRYASLIALIAFTLACPGLQATDDRTERLLETMPADAWIVVIVDRPDRALPPGLIAPILNGLARDRATAEQMLSAIQSVPGGFAVGMIAPPKFDDAVEPGLFYAMTLNRPDADFGAWFEKQLFPALHLFLTRGALTNLKVERSEAGLRIVDTTDDRAVATFATREKVVFGANKANRVGRWRRGEYPKKHLLGEPGVREMLRRLPTDAAVRVLINPRALVAAFPKPRPNTPEEILRKILAPDEFKAVAIDLCWEKQTLRLRASALLADDCKGLARVLSGPVSESQCMGQFPPDFQMLARLAWPSAQGVVDHAFELTSLFDETIAQEYREDLAAFKSKTGVNWDTDVLSQLQHEAALGLRIDFTRRKPIGWAAVLPVAGPAVIEPQLARLVAHFGLPLALETHGGISYRRHTSEPEFCLALIKDRLILADSKETLLDLSKSVGRKDAALPLGRNLRRAYERIGRANQFAAILDLELLVQKVPLLTALMPPQLAPLIWRGTIGMSMTRHEQLVTFEAAWDPGRPVKGPTDKSMDGAEDEALMALTAAASDVLAKAAREARRKASMSNIRTIGMALAMYVEQHKQYPEDLATLLRASPDLLSLAMFRSPYDGVEPRRIEDLGSKSYLILRTGLPESVHHEEIVLIEKEVNEGQICALFADGHVETIQEPRASEIIELFKTGAPSIRK